MIFNILKNNFEWMKKDFILLIFLILISSFAFRVVDTYGPLKFIILLFFFARCILFATSYSIIPSSFVGKDQFSWKYLQGLPLGKKELIVALILSSLMMSLPFLIYLISFRADLKDVFSFLSSPIHSLINICLFWVFISFVSVINLIQHPRKEFVRQNSKKQLVRFLRVTLLIAVFFVFLGIAIDHIETAFNIDLFAYITKGGKFFWKIITSWWSVPIFITMIIMSYFYTLNVWTNEKLSYSSGQMSLKKEYTIIVASFALLFFMCINIDFKTPSLYRGELTEAVFQKNYQKIEKELKKHPDVNARNMYDMSPMFVAIREGNLEMVKYLESKGANFEGDIKDKRKNYFGFDALLFAISSRNVKLLEYIIEKGGKIKSYNELTGYYPIHLAAYNCNSQIVDLLIKLGADINSKNQKGETPLIVTSREGCLSVAVSLKEAGADFNLVDKSGKLAWDQIKNMKYKNNEFIYFLEKNSRVPANAVAVPKSDEN